MRLNIPARRFDESFVRLEVVGVRYGRQVHVYNNYYVIPDPAAPSYSWGVGFQPLPLEPGRAARGSKPQPKTTRRLKPAGIDIARDRSLPDL